MGLARCTLGRMTRLLTVRLLDRFEVDVDGRLVPPDAWTRRRAASLVKLLALAPGHRLPRDVVLDTLWPDLDPHAAAANLRKAAHFARRILHADDAVVLGGETVRLLPAGSVETDVADFAAIARNALDRADAELCRSAAALYRADLLPDDAFEPWTGRPREELRAVYRDLLVAAGLWGRMLEVDPTSEVAHREIMRERLEAGDRSGAIRQFDQLRTLLRDELGVSPGPESVALYERILAIEERDAPTPAERARALLAWGTIHWERADLGEAERATEEARALAIDAGLGRELADASELMGLIAYAQGRWKEVFADQFLETVDRDPELAPFILDAHLCMSEFALHEAGGLATVAAFARDLDAAATRSGSSQVHAFSMLLRAEVELLGAGVGAGDLAETRRTLEEAVLLHIAAASTTGSVIATERLAEAAGRDGDQAEALRLHQEALQSGLESAVRNHLVPLIYGGLIESSDPTSAPDRVREGERALAGMRACAPCSMSFHVNAVLACAEHDDERAAEHLAAAEQIAGMWQGGAWHAALDEARAALLLVGGADDTDVRARLLSAAEGFRVEGRHREEARCRVTLERMR